MDFKEKVVILALKNMFVQGCSIRFLFCFERYVVERYFSSYGVLRVSERRKYWGDCRGFRGEK